MIQVWITLEDDTVYELQAQNDFTYSAIRNSITLTNYIPPQYSEIAIEYVILSSYLGEMPGDSSDTFLP